MQNASYVALSQQLALRQLMDVVANNLANVSTSGFKADRALFSEYLSSDASNPTIPGATQVSFVREAGMIRDMRAGTLMQTGNSFDLAIHGEGYFAVETPSGVRYTRSGTFRPDGQGHLVTADGYALLDTSSRPIQIRPGESAIEVNLQGGVSSESGPIGRLQVVRFEDEQAMRKISSNLYEPAGEPRSVGDETEVRQGMIEGSNVQAVIEMTNMIEIMRRYQTVQRLLEAEHERERRAIQSLPTVN